MAKLTINDIARLSGVSKKTVSRVINKSPMIGAATRARVEAVIAEHHFVPNPQARALALRRNFLIALVDDGSDPDSLLTVQDAVLAALAGSDYALALCRLDPGPTREAQLRRFVEAHRPAGLVLLPALAQDAALAGLCGDLECAAIGIGGAASGDAVNCHERAAAAQAVTHLVALGHRRIAMITGPEGSPIAQARELGYLDAMADHELDRGPALIAGGDFSFVSGRAAGELLLEVSPRPTAILAAGDAMAAGALHAALDRGLAVPGGLSVMGIGDARLAAQLWPPLCSMRLPLAAMARAAALRLIGGDDDAADFSAALVPRASVAAPALAASLSASA